MMTTPAPILVEGRPTFRKCPECGNDFELPPYRLAAELVHICPGCSEKHAEQDQRDASARSGVRRTEAWNSICPALFRDTDPSRLPRPTKLQAALNWQYGPRGLILFGATDKGKSRVAWEVLKREFKAGKTVAAIDCAFGYTYAAKFAESTAEAARYVERLMSVDLLLLDDVLKVKLTDSFEQALFAIVNERTERLLPVILTTNDTGETLLDRMSADRGPALLRRLRQFCTSVNFDS